MTQHRVERSGAWGHGSTCGECDRGVRDVLQRRGIEELPSLYEDGAAFNPIRDSDIRDSDIRDSDIRDPDGSRAVTDLTAALTEQARTTAVENTRRLQDSALGVVRQGQDATLALAAWTETLRRPGPFEAVPAQTQARDAVSSGFDLFVELLAGQRRFVDALIDQQRRFAEALLTPPDHR